MVPGASSRASCYRERSAIFSGLERSNDLCPARWCAQGGGRTDISPAINSTWLGGPWGKKSTGNAYGRRCRKLRVRGYWQAGAVNPRKLAFVG